jgi:membrane-associated phospholipid phosphatase
MHRMVVAAELTMPDAFPSGHALMSMVVIGMTWRLYRPAFKFVVGPSLGCVLATVALRYHYVVDVIAAAALFPVVWLGGIALNRLWEDGRLDVSAPQKREPSTSSLP